VSKGSGGRQPITRVDLQQLLDQVFGVGGDVGQADIVAGVVSTRNLLSQSFVFRIVECRRAAQKTETYKCKKYSLSQFTFPKIETAD